MTKDEALTLALDALEQDNPLGRIATIDAIKKALETSELTENILSEYGLQAIDFVADFKKAQWVNLTESEILDLFDQNNVYGAKWIEFARSVEKKLREKNQ